MSATDNTPPKTKAPNEFLERNALELMSRDQIEAEYGITKRWLELAALSGRGPPMIKISRRMVRYQRGAFEAWLTELTVSSTSVARVSK